MSQVNKQIRAVWVKITSIAKEEYYDDYKDLVGRVFFADFVMHLGDGVYSIQVEEDNKYRICTSCRIRFIKKEKNPEYFL